MTWITVYKDYLFKDSLIQATGISYPTKNFCIITTNKSWYIKTTDGGLNWNAKRVEVPLFKSNSISVNMFDESHGLMLNYKTLLISNDGFETYDTIPLPREGYINNVYMISPHSFYLLLKYNFGNYTSDISIYGTSDDGKNWTEVFQLKYPYFNPSDMKFTDSLFGYIVGEVYEGSGSPKHNVIFRTTNGGKMWELMMDTILYWNPFGLVHIDVLDRKNAIVLGQFGTIYWTHDGGENWQLDSNAAILYQQPATLFPCILGENTALIADNWDEIYRSSLKPTDVEEEKRENNINIINDNWISINCSSEKTCDLRIEYYDLLGNLALKYTKKLQNTLNNLDINSLIEEKGIFIYRVYVNDFIVKSGKVIK